MPLPRDDTERKAFFEFVCRGNPAAIEYLEMVTEIVFLADESVDEALDWETRQTYMVRLLFILGGVLPMNGFYQQYAANFAPLWMDILIHWQKSDQWKMKGDLKRKIFGFVRRENVDSLAVATAALLGGPDHAGRVTEMLLDTVHATGETLDDWINEGKP